ncbi:MAG: hypothetical protein ABSD89_05905 [Halobacteriota archaeon]
MCCTTATPDNGVTNVLINTTIPLTFNDSITRAMATSCSTASQAA